MFPNGFYAVFVVGGEDSICNSRAVSEKMGRIKEIMITVHQTISYEYYVVAVGVTIGAITAFYIIMFLVSFLYFMR